MNSTIQNKISQKSQTSKVLDNIGENKPLETISVDEFEQLVGKVKFIDKLTFDSFYAKDINFNEDLSGGNGMCRAMGTESIKSDNCTIFSTKRFIESRLSNIVSYSIYNEFGGSSLFSLGLDIEGNFVILDSNFSTLASKSIDNRDDDSDFVSGFKVSTINNTNFNRNTIETIGKDIAEKFNLSIYDSKKSITSSSSKNYESFSMVLQGGEESNKIVELVMNKDFIKNETTFYVFQKNIESNILSKGLEGEKTFNNFIRRETVIQDIGGDDIPLGIEKNILISKGTNDLEDKEIAFEINTPINTSFSGKVIVGGYELTRDGMNYYGNSIIKSDNFTLIKYGIVSNSLEAVNKLDDKYLKAGCVEEGYLQFCKNGSVKIIDTKIVNGNKGARALNKMIIKDQMTEYEDGVAIYDREQSLMKFINESGMDTLNLGLYLRLQRVLSYNPEFLLDVVDLNDYIPSLREVSMFFKSVGYTSIGEAIDKESLILSFVDTSARKSVLEKGTYNVTGEKKVLIIINKDGIFKMEEGSKNITKVSLEDLKSET